jgi:hypothetical protein
MAIRACGESSRQAGEILLNPGPGQNQKRKITMKLQNIIHILIGIVCIGLLPKTQAVSPPPDGGYSGNNTAEGSNALFGLTTGTNNTAVGFQALLSVTTGNQNTATGSQALKNNTASNNTANGFQALVSNTIGHHNTATGWRALYSSRTAILNTATGSQALYSNTDGFANTATGANALLMNSSGGSNTAIGGAALNQNRTGDFNTAIGAATLSSISTSSRNTAVGYQALASLATGNGNIAIGDGAWKNVNGGNDNIIIGSIQGVCCSAPDGYITIGDGSNPAQAHTQIAGIRGVTTGNFDAIPVVIDSFGQLGTMSSSQRFKKDIKPMDKASETILALKPVTFEYKSDKANTPQFGLVAEEVAKASPDLVVRDRNGEIYSVRYDAVNAMLLNEFLKEHKKTEKQEATITQLKNDFQTVSTQQRKEIQLLSAQLKEQSAQIQKVSAQLEASKAAPQVVNNP